MNSLLPDHVSQPKTQPKALSRGFSLVELMVAMVLSIALIGGALMVYSSTSSSYRAQEANAQLIESGRTAIELISRDLRMAEYWRCIGWQAANLSNHLPYQQRGIYSANGANGAPDSLRMLQALDPTAVTVQAQVTLAELNLAMVPATVTPNAISVSSGAGFAANDIVVINDCAKGDVFTITGVNNNTISHNCTTCVETYGVNSTLLRVQDTTYQIANNADSQPALFRVLNGGVQEELLAGVEDMQVFFGEDTDSDGVANRYVTAEVINEPCSSGTNPGCWLRVVTVRVALLLRTLEDNVVIEPQTYVFNGATVTATDRRMRRAFTFVVALRNQFNN